MANTESDHKVVASLDTAGSTSAVTVRGARLVDIGVNIGSGVTIDLEGEYEVGASNAKDWFVIESYTVDTFKVMRFASTRRVRLTLSAGSATTLVELTAGNKE